MLRSIGKQSGESMESFEPYVDEIFPFSLLCYHSDFKTSASTTVQAEPWQAEITAASRPTIHLLATRCRIPSKGGYSDVLRPTGDYSSKICSHQARMRYDE